MRADLNQEETDSKNNTNNNTETISSKDSKDQD
jgi:hypothetical protein